MANIFGIGTSALLAFQRALATTGHNVGNVATPGYSRQRVEFGTRPPDFMGFGFLGTGVQVDTVRRVFDDFAQSNLRTQLTGFNQFQTLSELAGRLDNLLGDEDAGLAKPLQEFFNSMLAVSNDPTGGALRQAALADTESLVARFNGLADEFARSHAEVNSRIRTTIDDINGLTATIADLNQQIAEFSSTAGSGPPNDLLDQRDAAIEALSRKLAVSTVAQDDGTIGVFTGSGQALVMGASPLTLAAVPQLQDPQELDIALQGASGPVRIGGLVSGGELGGLVQYRDEVLTPAENTLGRIAVGLATAFNEQHRIGMDLDGELGDDFFTMPQAQVIADSRNTGAGAVSVNFDDVGALTADDYELRFSGGAWQLTRQPGGEVVAFESGSGTAADPFIVEGLAIRVDTAAANGDRFAIRPTRAGATGIGLAITDPRDIAAAGALATQAISGNAGDAQISAAQVIDRDHPNLLDAVDIVFDDPPTSYRINAGPSQAYTAGDPITVNGLQLSFSGRPQAGDAFTVRANTGGVGDNRNVLALAGLQDQLSLARGSLTIGGAYHALVADVGIQTRSAQSGAKASESALEQAQARRDAVSGVNLDEEAARLVQFQQAYQAAAQVISTAESMFQTLLDAVRR
jgi:flagellar hook-associated protein 1 FlgK